MNDTEEDDILEDAIEDGDQADNNGEAKDDEKLAGKFLSDRSKQVGRDGAYLEVDCRDVVSKVEEIAAARMVVLNSMRLEITEPGHVIALQGIIAKVVAGDYDDDLGEMEPDQKSFYVFRKIFEIGLLAMAEACGVES